MAEKPDIVPTGVSAHSASLGSTASRADVWFKREVMPLEEPLMRYLQFNWRELAGSIWKPAWIERRDFGEWTEKDNAEFEKWRDAAPEHRIAFLRLEAGWQRGEIMVALRPLQPESHTSVRASRSRLFGMIAIGLALVLTVAGGATVYLSSSQSRTYETGVGGRQTIALNDGSQIELNTVTVLRVAEQSNQRTIWLDKGEAYFQVRHDAARPFVVKTGAYRVVDLGTKFSIRAPGDGIEVALMEGRARLQIPDAKKGPQSTDLTPGDVAAATGTSFSVTKKPLAYDLGWRQGF